MRRIACTAQAAGFLEDPAPEFHRPPEARRGTAGGGEIYSWKGASQFDERDLDEWIPEGAIGTGPFAASLLSVFEPHRAAFTFEGERSMEGRRLLEYGFEVPVE